MSKVIETLTDYQTFLKYDRHIKPATIRKVDLSLRYFTQLYGLAETKELKAADMYIFYEWLKGMRCKKKKNGEEKPFENVYLQKIMTHVKSYVKWLSDTAQLNKLVPADVPRGKVKAKIPLYLTKDEMALIMQCLEKNVAQANVIGDKHRIYSAHLWRAVIWMLYSSGLRNFELRSLTYDDINIPQLCGTVLGKGDKYGVYSFSDKTKETLEAYLHVRETFFPDTKFRYIFTLYKKGIAMPLTEQKLNVAVKKVARDAGVKQNVHAHLFRHTLATHLIMHYGWSLVDVRDKLRHSNIAVTSVYLSSNPASIKSMTGKLGDDLLA